MTTFFLVDKGREDPSTTISGLSLCGSSFGDPENFVRKGPNITIFFYDKGREVQVQYHYKRAFRWRANDGLILNAGLVALRFFRRSDMYC